MQWVERVSQIRQQLNIPLYRNIAIAQFQINGKRGELIAVSGRASRLGTIDFPQAPIFATFEVPPGHSRSYDAEYKLLEALALAYLQSPTIQGKIDLFTERPPCASCTYVIEQFRLRFPRLTLVVIYSSSTEQS